MNGLKSDQVCRRAELKDLPEIAKTYALAFDNDPVTSWLIRCDKERGNALRGWFSYGLERFFPSSKIFTSDDHSVCSSWFLSNSKLRELTEQEKQELDNKRIFWYTEQGLLRSEIFQRLEEEKIPSYLHWHLGMLAVRPKLQGRGLGSSHLTQILNMVDKDHLPVYLESTNSKNLPFYERHGFKTSDNIQLPDGPMIDCMLRVAR